MKNELVRVNKEMNLTKVELEEGFQNFYVNILQRINTMEQYEPITLTKNDLIKLLGVNSRNTEYLHNIFVRLTGSNEIKIGEKKIYGSIFSAKAEKDNFYTIYVNDPYKEFLFTKADIDLMHKAKKYKHLPLSKDEAEYWHKKLKEKKKFLMILNNKSIKVLRGKNNKIIYSMLKEFAGSCVQSGEHKGECFKTITYKEFKEILQLPDTCRNDNLDRAVVKAKKDITELTELTITDIKKYPEKPGVKKEYMIIFFYEKAGAKAEEENKKKADIIDELLTVQNEEAKQEKAEEKEEFIQDDDVIQLKNLIKQQTKNRKDRFELWAKMMTINDVEKLFEFIKNNDLIINLELPEE